LGALTFGGSLLILFGPFALGLWLAPEFRTESGMILRWLTLGITLLSLAYIPRFLIQASGKPALTAILCLCEVPLYLGLAFYGFAYGGATGVAMAWTLRCLVHMVSLYSFATPRLPGFAAQWKGLLPRLLICLALLAGLVFLPDPAGMPWTYLPIPPAIGLGVWFVLFHREERELILHPLKSLKQKQLRR
jgi:O-antigen/teichoic acid export membrane protein